MQPYGMGMKTQVQPVAVVQAPPPEAVQLPSPAQHGCVVEQF
jgi:hypothetical protein